MGQFLTPAATARLLASLSQLHRDHIRVLDAGAGVGSLTAAWVAGLALRARRPKRVSLVTYEIDEALHDPLRGTLADCSAACADMGVACDWDVRGGDFVEAMVDALDHDLFQEGRPTFDVAILNPPYKKFPRASRPRMLLRRLGIETGNLYAAFLALAIAVLDTGGELIAVTPRSFCNGPYFRPFREYLLRRVSLTHVHTFESRWDAFRDDDVLQENLVFRAVRARQGPMVQVAESRTPGGPLCRTASVAFDRMVRAADPERFIHLAIDEKDHALASRMLSLPCSLGDLGIAVSTGRVIDFRAKAWLRSEPELDTAPLIYPTHLDEGRVVWPKPGSGKPSAIVRCPATANLLVPSGNYVLVKRFSAKEERRRIVAAMFDGASVHGAQVGFENHLNYYHAHGRPLDVDLASGLALFLNSTPVDAFFRQFNGHTQVNATDLRSLRYPTASTLRRLGTEAREVPGQAAIDALVGAALR